MTSPTRAILISVFCATVVFVTLAHACKPTMDKMAVTLEYKTWKSDVLAYGYPRRRTRDTRYPDQEMYFVDFEVRCIFRGGPLKPMIRIFNVGKLDPLCQATELPLNKRLLVFLNREGDNFVQTFKEDPGGEEYLEEVVVLCGITVNYPIGYSAANNHEKCTEEWNYSDCIPLPTAEPEIFLGGYTTESFMDGVTKGVPQQPDKSPNDGGHSSDNKDDTTTTTTTTTTNDNDNDDNKKYKNTGNKDTDSSKHEVKIGAKKEGPEGPGGKKSENLEQDTTTKGNKTGDNKASAIISLVSLMACLIAYFGRV